MHENVSCLQMLENEPFFVCLFLNENNEKYACVEWASLNLQAKYSLFCVQMTLELHPKYPCFAYE